jgi:hypothetical protein
VSTACESCAFLAFLREAWGLVPSGVDAMLSLLSVALLSGRRASVCKPTPSRLDNYDAMVRVVVCCHGYGSTPLVSSLLPVRAV